MGSFVMIVIGALAGTELAHLCEDHVVPAIKSAIDSISKEEKGNENNDKK